MIDDRLGKRRTNSGDMSEQMIRCRIQIHSHMVDAAVDHLFETLFQGILRNIVLVLSDSDALRIGLDEFGKRILQTPCDRDGSTNGHIKIWKFGSCHLRSGVDRSSGLTDHDDRNRKPQLLKSRSQENFGFAARSSISNGNR